MASKDKRRLSRNIRRKALGVLSRDRLWGITEAYQLSVEDRRIIDQHIGAIMRSRSIDFARLLEHLNRDELKDICRALGVDDGGREKTPLVERILSLAEEQKPDDKESLDEAEEPSGSTESITSGVVPTPPEEPRKAEPLVAPAAAKDARKVFIIHGRERAILQELKRFLRALGLQAWTFDDENHEAAANTHIAEIVSRGVSKTKAVIALLTPDEFSCLSPDLRHESESARNIQRWQPRPNVIYEAGMAMGLNPQGTILVTVGHVELPSDLDGILHLKLANTTDSRRALRKRLSNAGCAVDPSLEEWMEAAEGGDFSHVPTRPLPSDPFPGGR